MTNNYLLFSEVLPNLSDPEITWLKEQLQQVFDIHGQQYREKEIPAGLDPDRAEWSGCRAFLDMVRLF
ncbi:MAG TPA: hypothetical protein VFE46_02720 [Pirellulales bacterium]|jgi:hypothetical protein|nr:hypothetical protein [Pirellulales bacterium]